MIPFSGILPRPPKRLLHDIIWKHEMRGLAAEIGARMVIYRIVIPANDTDRFRW